MIKECLNCGKEIETIQNNRKYCCIECKFEYKEKNPKYEKECMLCGKKFKTNDKRQKYCGKECAIEAQRTQKNKKLICLHCGKEFHKRHRGKKDANKFCSRECAFEYRRIHTGRYCLECGKELAPRQIKYCSQECKEKRKIYICHYCGKRFMAKNEKKYCCKECKIKKQIEKNRQKKIKEYIPQKRVCKYCGKEFWTEYGKKNRMFCSQECGKRYEREQRKIKRRLRIITNGNYNEDITLRKVYKKYKGICCICGKKVNYKDFHYDEQGNFITGDKYPSIDHIIPLSKGGTHTWNNIQLAHRGCNSLKSDGYVVKENGQLSIM